jgi:hypothetical protein
MNRDEVLIGEEEMVLADLDPSLVQLGGEENDEGIAAVFLDLGPLVLVPDVLECQRVELERLFQQRVVGVIRILDIQPEAALAFRQARRDVARNGLDLGALGCDEVAGNGYPLPDPPRKGEGVFI